MSLTTNMKVAKFHSKMKSHMTKQLLTSISVDMRIYMYLPLKVIFTFRVDKSLCLPKLK